MIIVNDKEIPWREKISLQEVLGEVGISVDSLTLIIVNGKLISYSEQQDEEVEDESVIRVMRIVSGG